MTLKLINAPAFFFVLACGATLFRAPVASAQTPAIAVTGAVAKPLSLTSADLSHLPRAKVDATSNGVTTSYEGVWLHDVLKHAGVSAGPGMRGSALASYVVAKASDGYRVLFSLGEIDSELTDGEYLVADMANGKPLYGEHGSFHLVVPKDKRGARSVRMLNSLDVVQLKP